jgi:hypothetical protein
MRVFEGLGHLRAELRRAPPLEPAALLEQRGERAAGDQFHDDPGDLALQDHVVHRDDAGMAQPGRGARLAHRAPDQLPAFLVGEPVRQQDLLRGDLTVQQLVLRPPDPAHAASADRGEQQVTPADL